MTTSSLPPVPTKVFGISWVGHHFVETSLHLMRLRQAFDYRVLIDVGIVFFQKAPKSCPFPLIRARGNDQHSPILRRLDAKSPGPHMSDRFRNHGKHHCRIRHRHKRSFADLDAGESIPPRWQINGKRLIGRFNLYLIPLRRVYGLQFKEPQLRCIASGPFPRQHRDGSSHDQVTRNLILLNHRR
jgi:hypothetical protein